MKIRKFIPAALAVVLLVVMAGVAYAFGMGNVDGVWQYVEDNPAGGAYCVTYGTGQGNSTTARSRNNPAIQTPPNTDENQVRYGKGSSTTGDCPTSAPTLNWFNQQSGLGFDGNNNVGASLTEGVPFWLGRLTHYNFPIYLTDSGATPPQANFLEWVDIDVTVTGIVCGNGQAPNEGSTLTFTYRVLFDETPNNADPCPYGGNANGCYDAVTIDTNPTPTNFSCTALDEPNPGAYTIALLGFQGHGTSTDCSTQTYNSSAIATQFITQEQSTNNACLWAQIVDFVPTAVTLADFSAVQQGDAILLTWETSMELDNRGFNLYRGTSPAGPDRQLNDLLIPSQSQGGPIGYIYTWEDQAELVPDTSYFYWLEDVDIHGATSMHGPVSVDFTAPTAVTVSSMEASSATTRSLGWQWAVAIVGLALTFGYYSQRARSRAL